MDNALNKRLMALMQQVEAFKFGNFTLTSGKKSDFYCDARRISNHAEGGPLIGELILDLLEDQRLEPVAVGGLESGALPVASHVQAAAHYVGSFPIQSFYVKKKQKTHGMGRRIEGLLEEGDKVVILEDVITTGGSALQACEAVREAGAEILAVVAVFDREDGGKKNIEAEGHQVFSLLKRSDFGEATN